MYKQRSVISRKSLVDIKNMKCKPVAKLSTSFPQQYLQGIFHGDLDVLWVKTVFGLFKEMVTEPRKNINI